MRRRSRKGRSGVADERYRERGQEIIARDQGRDRGFLHSFAGQSWRPGGSELRDGFRGEERKVPRVREGHHPAYRGGASALRKSGGSSGEAGGIREGDLRSA